MLCESIYSTSFILYVKGRRDFQYERESKKAYILYACVCFASWYAYTPVYLYVNAP